MIPTGGGLDSIAVWCGWMGRAGCSVCARARACDWRGRQQLLWDSSTHTDMGVVSRTPAVAGVH